MLSVFHPSISRKDRLKEEQNNIVMAARPLMKKDFELAGLQNGLFVYSMWSGYRDSDYQKAFENCLNQAGFTMDLGSTSVTGISASALHKLRQALRLDERPVKIYRLIISSPCSRP